MTGLTPEDERLLDLWRYEQRNDAEIERDMDRFGLRPRRRRGYRKPAKPKQTAPTELVTLLLASAPDRRAIWDPQARPWAEVCGQSWSAEMFTLPEIREWLNAGVHGDEFELAAELRREGFTPHLVGVVIRGESILDRVRRAEYSYSQLLDLLRREGHLKAS